MNDSGAGERQPETRSITGGVSGNVVQAGNIHGNVYFKAPENTVIPRQLGPPPANFTGRTAERAELTRILDTRGDGPTIAVISGPGGVGKSALALRWLHDVVDRYPDGQLYVDLAPDGEPAALDVVLGHLLRALGVAAERIPVDVDAAAAHFRSETAGRRIAILLDNAVSTAQVRTLLPAEPGCLVVVSTRWRLGGLAMAGARFVTVAPLAVDAGVELLARTVGGARPVAEPEEIARLAELCGGLPIALTIAGAQLAMRPDRSVGRVVRDLADERRRLSILSVEREISVRSVFDLSYRGLPVAEARAYRWLGLHPGPSFRAELAAAMLMISAERTEDLLTTLVDASLLDVRDERYHFHDLVRLHARERAEQEDPASERAAVVERVLTYYLRFTADADRVVIPLEWRLGPVYDQLDARPRHETAAAALDDLETELPNLMAALRAGATLGFDDLVWQLCEAMWSFFLYRKHFPDWLAAYQLGVEAAARSGNEVAMARMQRRRGLALHNLNREDEAAEHGEAALVTARAAGNERAEAEALQLIGMADRARGRLDHAVEVLSEAANLAGRLGLARDEALASRRLGQTLTAAGRLDEAVDELRRSRAQAAALADAHLEAMTTVWLVDALTRADRPGEALELVPAAWEAVRESGSAQYRAHVLKVWGEAAAAAGDLPTAVDRLTRARDLYAEIGVPHVDDAQRALDEARARLP